MPIIRTIPRSIATVHDRLPTMGTLGFAAEQFDPYVHPIRRGAHGHDHAEFIFIQRGNAASLVDGVEYKEQEGTVVVVPFGDCHELLTDRRGIRVVNLYIDPRRFVLPGLSGETRRLLEPLFPSGPAFAHRANRRMLVRPPSAQRLSAALELILGEQRSLERSMAHQEDAEAGQGAAEAMTAGMILYLVELARGVREMVRSGSYGAAGMDGDFLRRSGGPAERLRAALDFHPERPMDLAGAAAAYGVTPSHLCRAFKSLTGLRPVEYLHRRRIERAMLLLDKYPPAPGAETIGAVALSVGFNDLSLFNEKFKALTGTTPREYRAARRRALQTIIYGFRSPPGAGIVPKAGRGR